MSEKQEFLYPHQREAVAKMHNGCILNGGVGSGKSRTGLYYYFKEQGGSIENGKYTKMQNPRDLYIITAAIKRDKLDWWGELSPFLMSPDPEVNYYKNKIVIDSWQNIKKYKDVYGAFFIFDEDHLTGSGVWVKTFFNIARKNKWIILSATPGDKWEDYYPVFRANGFYRTKKEFEMEHVIYSRFTKYPKVDRYINTGKLMRQRAQILVDMPFERDTIPHHEDIWVSYDSRMYKELTRTRWNPYKDAPIVNGAELCYTWRKIVNSDISRQLAVLELFEKHPRLIIFYNFDYELDILRNMPWGDKVKIAEWNGHVHMPLPDSKSWVYLLQYSSASEAFNCTKTDAMVFYSQNYSYKTMEQASGRIDRMNTPFRDLYYYHLKSRAPIDLAIGKALSMKKRFNESAYVKW